MSKKLKEMCPLELNHFSGVLPYHHNEIGCHNASQKRRRIICEMKAMLQNLNRVPKCQEWDTSETTKDTPGPFKFGVFQQRNGKPWEPHRVKSSELVASQLTPACICLKRNGLQDDCRMQQCRGKNWCLTEPWPECPPFTKIPGEYMEPDPLEICPNYYKGKVMAGDEFGGTTGGYSPGQGMHYPGGPCCDAPREMYVDNGQGTYRFERVPQCMPCAPPQYPMYRLDPYCC